MIVEQHVRKELEIYSPMVTVRQYLVVEDTNVNGHPVFPQFGPGPAEATADFLQSNHNFIADRERERYPFTFNPGGWLKRIR